MKRIVLVAMLTAVLSVPVLAEDLAVPEEGYAVSGDLKYLPDAVREKREALLAAARTGDMEQLRTVFEAELAPPMVSFGEPEDGIAYLKQQSGDGQGIEILAILAKLLEAPYAAMDGGDGDLVYVWPYLAAYDDLRTLTPAELFDGYKLLGYRGFEDQREIGGWIHWRLYITSNGNWQAFVIGD